jgi:hypothetical protein
MNPRLIIPAVLSVVFAAPGALSQEAPPLLTPTREHEQLTRDVGVWDAESNTWTAPDFEPTTSKGVETVAMMGKFWQVTKFEGDMMGEPFEGRGQLTYDPVKKKYVGTWIDTMAPVLLTMSGQYADPHTLAMMLEGIDPATSQPTKWKSITRYADDDHKTFEMYAPVAGQEDQWWKIFEIKYTRRK